MEDKIFQVPSTITKVTSMANKTLRLQCDTQENLPSESMARLMALLDEYGHFCFLVGDRQIDTLDVIELPPLKAREEDTKSPAQRLRAKLWLLWRKNGEKGDSETYYRSKMEKFINAVDEKLT